MTGMVNNNVYEEAMVDCTASQGSSRGGSSTQPPTSLHIYNLKTHSAKFRLFAVREMHDPRKPKSSD